MKAILFLSFFMLFVDVIFSTPYGNAWIIDIMIINFNVIFAEDPTEHMFQAVDDVEAGTSGLCAY